MKVRKGSFTIEAACVMSLVLITVMGVLYLSFFVHNRSWLTAAAYEAALAGSIEGVQKNGQIYEAASAKAQELGNVGFFGAENLSYLWYTYIKKAAPSDTRRSSSHGLFPQNTAPDSTAP